MLSFIQANYQIGDAIEIKTSVGTFSGKIEFINPSIIVLRQDDGKICGIGAADVRSFTGEKDSPFVTPVLPAAAASVVSSTGVLPDATVALQGGGTVVGRAVTTHRPQTEQAQLLQVECGQA